MRFLNHRGRPIFGNAYGFGPKKTRRRISPSAGAILVFLCGAVLMGAATQINLVTQVKGVLAIGNGGTNTSSTLTGLVRGGSAYTAAELSGDATTAGSNAVTVAKVNGTSVGVNSAADQTIVTTAAATGSWASIPNCTGALQYSTSTHSFSCGAVLTGTFADAEVPTGTINGVNTSFTLAAAPSPSASLQLYLNGQQLIAGAGADYTLSSTTITMASAPKTGDLLIAFYRH